MLCLCMLTYVHVRQRAHIARARHAGLHTFRESYNAQRRSICDMCGTYFSARPQHWPIELEDTKNWTMQLATTHYRTRVANRPTGSVGQFATRVRSFVVQHQRSTQIVGRWYCKGRKYKYLKTSLRFCYVFEAQPFI